MRVYEGPHQSIEIFYLVGWAENFASDDAVSQSPE